jgi:hypothetical protein
VEFSHCLFLFDLLLVFLLHFKGPLFGAGNANSLALMVNGSADSEDGCNDYGAGDSEAYQPDGEFRKSHALLLSFLSKLIAPIRT